MFYKFFLWFLVGMIGLMTTNNLSVEDSEVLILFSNEDALITQAEIDDLADLAKILNLQFKVHEAGDGLPVEVTTLPLSLIHISEPTRPY